jgi:hypothetical protein
VSSNWFLTQVERMGAREWIRIVAEDNTNPRPPTTTTMSNLPGPTSAWGNGEALRGLRRGRHSPGQALARMDTKLGFEPSALWWGQIYHTVPMRRIGRSKDAEVLLRTPLQVTSRPPQSTLTFSPPQSGWWSHPTDSSQLQR